MPSLKKPTKPAAKPAPEPVAPAAPTVPNESQNPASDPNLTAQERLDALTKQHEEMRKNPTGGYPL